MNQKVFILIVMFVVFVSGCYSRTEFKNIKSTPPKAKVQMAFEVTEALVSFPIETLERQIAAGVDQFGTPLDPKTFASARAQARQQSEAIRVMGEGLKSVLNRDLLKYRLGFPMAEEGASADLKISGVFRPSNFGVGFDWKMVDVHTGAVVAAGSEESIMFNVEPFADSILAGLMEINLDKYAKGGGRDLIAPEGITGSVDSPRASGTDGANSWAVIVGVEQYRDEIPAATHAENDAKVFARFAEETLGVPSNQIKLLLGERAGLADLSSAFEEWLPRNARGKDAVVYIFFSGHGAPDIENGDAYLVPYDGDPSYLKTRGYGIGRLQRGLSKLKVGEVFVFFDACFSGTGDRSVLAKGTRPLVPVKKAKASAGVMSFAASSSSQATGEALQGDHGLFTHYLLEALQGHADSDKDGDLTLEEVVRHVTSGVERDARQQNREQRPVLTVPDGVIPGNVKMVKALK